MRSLAALIAVLAACAAAPVVEPGPQSRADFLREKMAVADDDLARSFVRDELIKVEFERAKTANTIYAYRHFLAEFPAGREATAARALLESLRFEEAAGKDTIEGWQVFLAETPRGRRTSEARARLGALEIADALASDDLQRVQRILIRHPEHAQRSALASHEDRLAWEAAVNGTLEEVERYLSERPDGVHRADAQRRARTLRREALLRSENLQEARRLAALADAEPADHAALAELQLRFALRELDATALQAVADDRSGGAATQALRDRARALATDLRQRPLPAAVRQAVEEARPGHGLRPRAGLVELLRTADPLARVEAVRELAEWGGVDSVSPVLEAAESSFLAVRLAAVDALGELAASMPPEVWSSLARRREQELVVRGVDVGAWRRIAALREASGDREGATEAWREVTTLEPEDPAAVSRLLDLERRRGDRLATGTAARELARTASVFTEGRWLQPPDEDLSSDRRGQRRGVLVGLSSELTVLRQICTGIELGEQAAGALFDLRSGASGGEQDLLGLAHGEIERTLVRLKAKRAELEDQLRRRNPSYIACGTDRSVARIAASREARAGALRRLGQLRDARVRAFVEARQHTPSPRVREAALEALEALDAS